ncbi:SAM-dependent methyltransferase RsmB/NOP2-type [Trinorchestia longiramus]|nr:SAM-dependent methyltransferase RsmB/NOP2-type [Trinorchestia longiramus]
MYKLSSRKLICVEQDSERFSVLRRRVKHHGVRCASFINQDFSSLTAEQYEGVTTVLLDPSCSNSGVDLPTDEASVSDERYRRLSDMQFKLLSFALNIPSVRTVVYSTCSVNSMENENVVARALDRFGDSFELEDLSLKLEGWRNFGDESYSFARKVLRTKPEFDLCHGFFVVKFVAREERNCMQQPYMDISNGISKTNDEIDPIKTRKKKKRDDKSLLCVAEIDFDKGTNFVEHGHATSIEKRGSEATVSLDVLRESEETASVCELKKNKKKKKKRNDMEKQLLNDESIPFKIKKSSSDEVQGLDGDEDLTTKKKKKKKRENADEMSALSTSNENFKLEMNEQQMTVSEVEKQNSCENFESKSRKKKKHQKDVIVDEGNQEHKKKKKKTEERQKLDGNDDLDSEKQGLKRVCCGEESLCDLENVRPKKKKKQDKVSLIGSFQEKK